MSIHDPALLSSLRNQMYPGSPMEAFFVKMMEEQLAKEKRQEAEADKAFKPPKFTLLQMIALSPFVAMIGSWVIKWMWNFTLAMYGIAH